MKNLPYIALGFLLGFFPGKVWKRRGHIVYCSLIVGAFLLGRYLPTVTITFKGG